ncbi:hypothetical protein GCM10010387_34140 [Streptomyces inusitatus]|uniref:Uncharacterized protein n=1 Tax=Streptomyces inusitatus TaxID=68221 RepID=A0A918UVG3_9ACTN|nr:hypothetical protein [Streptomyces inusitatus]GGZ37204.1 hypothetical protein GCM10010387_34140 [Streptomyces inusitatus]
MTSDVLPGGDFDAFLAALSAGKEMVVVAPNGTVNTGMVTGGQRQIVTTTPNEESPGASPMRQGPVRAKDLRTARRRFVPPPGYEGALATLEAGIAVLVGPPGTGRETHALNLLAHGREEAVLYQIDGAVDLTQWGPHPHRVQGYLVMEPQNLFKLRPWDLSRLELTLAEAGAHLLIVLTDSPGLTSAVTEHLGIPVLRHLPPDPRMVLAAHLKDVCTDQQKRTWILRSLASGLLDEMLPSELPPRRAAQAAEALTRIGIAESDTSTEVLYDLGRTEASELMARAREEPQLLAHLLSLGVYGGLERAVVSERAADLLKAAGSGWEHVPTVQILLRRADESQGSGARQQLLPEAWRALGVRCGPRAGTDGPDIASFYWPTTAEALWEVLCREHEDLSPLIHAWLAGTGKDPHHIERAGWTAAAMAAATGGRTLILLHHLVLSSWPPAAEIAARCLGLVARNPAAGLRAGELLNQWSVATEAPLRKAVAYACRPDLDGPMPEQSLELIDRLMGTLVGDSGDVDVAASITEVLVLCFRAGDARTKGAHLDRMRDWAALDGIPGLIVAHVFPLMAEADLSWCGDRVLAGGEAASGMVRLTGHTLNEPSTYATMRDVLLDWCRKADEASEPDPALTELLEGLTAARQPGFLRWLLAFERSEDVVPSKPSKELAMRLLALWRRRISTREPSPKGV